MGATTTNGSHCYIVPRRVIQGSASEMLDEIDEAIRALVALRQLIAVRDPAGLRRSSDDPDSQHR